MLCLGSVKTYTWQKVFCKNVLMRAYVTLTFLENKVLHTSSHFHVWVKKKQEKAKWILRLLRLPDSYLFF